jgi:GT2 family glycosyltransferase/glycosyltransferase involved in cell wall biosynthesis
MSKPRTLADVIRQDARDAMARGAAAQAEGALDAARLWFERARRLLPNDPAIALALAGVLLRQDPAAALALFTEASEQADTIEIWLGLAALQPHDPAAARAALAHLLSRHVLPADTTTIAQIAAASGAQGWCGVAWDATRGLIWEAHGEEEATAWVDDAPWQDHALPPGGRVLRISAPCGDLLGSPIDLAALRRVEGCVQEAEGGLSGWAWCPAHAEHAPWISIIAADGQSLRVQASGDMQAPLPLTRPRRFNVPAHALAAMPGKLRVTSEDGSDLAGSPLDPAAPMRAAMQAARLVAQCFPASLSAAAATELADFSAPAALAGPPAQAIMAPERKVAVVIAAYRDRALTLACLHSVFDACPEAPVIVVDDATPEPDLAAPLRELAQAGRITLIRHQANQGFPASANDGLRAALALTPPHDVLLLNSDTLVPRRSGASFLARLRAAVHGAGDIGTATPLSNDATILSYPARDGDNAIPDRRTLARLDAQAARANPATVIDIPTAIGFCMYVRHECALQTGLFRTDAFAQGYGEENDLCIRARHLGWRHVAVPGVFVAHCGAASFGSLRAALVARNLAVLERLHPGYHALIAAWQGTVPAEDALAPARRRLDARRWAAGRKPGATILITHDNGGGVERVVRARAAELAADGQRAIKLRPVLDPNSTRGACLPGLCQVSDAASPQDFPNLVFRLPEELADLLRLLRADRPKLVEVHHRLGHAPAVMQLAARLSVPEELHLHDYAAFCPRITLLGPERRYCGEPSDIASCEACVADAGDRTGEGIGVAARRARSAAEFRAARRVVVPSADMATRMRRHFPLLRPEIRALEDDAATAPPPPMRAGRPRIICVIGAIGVEKGFDVLLACARDAAARNLPLIFRLVGHSTDDSRLIATGRVFVTGRYGEAEAEALIRSQAAHLAFLPSIWPETWGFTLGLAWRAGLHAAVFDVGAMAARVRETGRGRVLPLGLPPGAINNVLLASGIPPLPHPARSA